MVRRVCRELGTKKNIIVINDEAHHCYRGAGPDDRGDEKLTGDERAEAEKREEEARDLDLGPGGGQAEDRRQGGLRPLGDAVLPARLGLSRRGRCSPGWSPTSR